jgi:hypothetical protein
MNPETLPLRAIHLPETVNWWPVAPVWWVLLAVVIITPFVIIQYRKWKAARFITIALKQLSAIENNFNQHQDSCRLLKDLSIFLRQCVMTLQTREDTASITGEAWLQLLDRLGETKEFTQGKGKVLLTAPYQNQPVANVEAIQKLVEDWVQTAYRIKGDNTEHKKVSKSAGAQHA